MLTLLVFKPALKMRSPSPFVVKADALLAMSGLPYEREPGNIRKAPKGKFPVLIDGENTIADSSHIKTYLETEKGIDFDGHLTMEQRAHATAFQRLIEDHLYFINMHFRWTDHADALRDTFFDDVPPLIRGGIFRMVKKGVLKSTHIQGISRHSRDEMVAFGKEDIDALATQLGDKPYMLDDKVSSLDACAYGALHPMIEGALDSPLKPTCMKHQNLVDYCTRFAEEVFDD